MSHLHQLVQRFGGLRVHTDDNQLRFCFPVASSELLFENSPTPAQRNAGELMDVVEKTVGGKFQLPLEASPALAVSARTSHPRGPLATLEIWSLEPGSYDLVLKVPQHLAQEASVITPLIERFVDNAREVSRTVDNLDLLRFQAGPGFSLADAQHRLDDLERQNGTQLDTDSLSAILSRQRGQPLN